MTINLFSPIRHRQYRADTIINYPAYRPASMTTAIWALTGDLAGSKTGCLVLSQISWHA
ncbi:hypothetical protein BaRGS_00000872, partial [Batillaria attramentaria]